ncbi:DUF4123 domain-containing protein [Pseudomonas folii]|uniref:DUF4123 domain-containing protein n=1 Tax=Pseudomonas folii TaxID=2762593 RepID=A0ABR7B092_9PSED|nr:DUF4123 domain-containing protein [Pseudomonas folii]MBC3950595.1 DUF4123 domain-containing protein [Pseudomonas folii]
MHGQSVTSAITLPDDFTWDKPVGLLLDAIQVENLLRSLYEWSPAPEAHVLYNGTRWACISQLSPCLVRIRDDQNPILQQFLANTAGSWGYLLVSDGSWDDLLAHMRWLTSIRPAEHDDMYLRISSPDVAHAIFAPEHHPDAKLFGPCQTVLVTQHPLPGWRQYPRPGERPSLRPVESFIPNDEQWAALQTVAYRMSVNQLYSHMSRFFPDYLSDLPPERRLERIHQLVESAIERGFRTRREIWLYANVFGFLGDEGLQSHPDIVELLNRKSDLTPHQRVDRAATLAAQRSTQ